MMDKKDIMEEGLLEKYLLDELSAEQAQMVEAAKAADSDLERQFRILEADFEQMALENAIPPPPRVKAQLISKLAGPPVRRLYPTQLWIAASFAAIFLMSTIWMYTNWQSARTQLDQLNIQTTGLQDRLELLEENYDRSTNRLQLINNPNTIPFVLTGNEKLPDSRAIAYVNHTDKLVLVNPKGLPTLPSNQTYQMWSDVEGEMINMGLLRTDQDLITVEYIDHAESLNITIEPAGGNDHPTVEQLVSYVTL